MRCFIAVEPDSEITDKLELLQKDLPKGVRPVEKENMHVTLLFLGEVDDDKVREISGFVSSISVDFRMICAGVGAFPKPSFPRVVWAGVEAVELHSLHEEICKYLHVRDDRFHPHITIGRVKQKVNVSDFVKRHERDFFGETQIKKVFLKKSTLTPAGPIYENIAASR
ncbi:MAG: RNA 2',3'-cyclic phosphodiesterase [Candidatus Micrarchaeia archaeon]